MAFIDTHTHLYQPAFDGDRDEAMARCAEAGVIPTLSHQQKPLLLKR